jgi:hypothetical protein
VVSNPTPHRSHQVSVAACCGIPIAANTPPTGNTFRVMAFSGFVFASRIYASDGSRTFRKYRSRLTHRSPRNGSNVRTMRTKFPPGRKGGEPQQEKASGWASVCRVRVHTASPARGRARIGRTRIASARSTVSGGWKMGSRNGLNVRTMRTRFPPGRKVAGHSRRIASGWASVRGARCAQLFGRGRRAGIGRIRTVESAGAPLADGVVPGWAAQPLARGRVSGAGCVPGRGSRLGEQLFRSRFSLCMSWGSGRGYVCLQGLRILFKGERTQSNK